MISDRTKHKGSFLHFTTLMWIYLFLVMTVLVVYSQVVKHDFVSFDDFSNYIPDNPNVHHGITIDAVKGAFKFSQISLLASINLAFSPA